MAVVSASNLVSRASPTSNINGKTNASSSNLMTVFIVVPVAIVVMVSAMIIAYRAYKFSSIEEVTESPLSGTFSESEKLKRRKETALSRYSVGVLELGYSRNSLYIPPSPTSEKNDIEKPLK